jgi:predicted enzyme related to lactoylglutathione lyase
MHVHDLTLLIGSSNLERLAAFYADTLQLEQLSSQHHIVFQAGAAKLRLIDHAEVGPRNPEPPRIQLNLFVSDVRTELARLEPLGVPIVRPPTQMAWGGWLVTLEDPDGNCVQLIEGS